MRATIEGDRIGPADWGGNLDGLAVIADATTAQLKDAAWLEAALVNEIGIYPAQGIPRHLWNLDGLGVCQFPNQFAPYLVHLSRLGIETYAEIGIWVGGAFAVTVEYLHRFGLKRALGVDVYLQESARRYAETQPLVQLLEAPSASDEASDALAQLKPDLILVDGDHTEAGCRADWKLACEHARWVAVHDIVGFPAVADLWAQIDLPKEEWTMQYEGFHPQAGLGLVTCASV